MISFTFTMLFRICLYLNWLLIINTQIIHLHCGTPVHMKTSMSPPPSYLFYEKVVFQDLSGLHHTHNGSLKMAHDQTVKLLDKAPPPSYLNNQLPVFLHRMLCLFSFLYKYINSKLLHTVTLTTLTSSPL